MELSFKRCPIFLITFQHENTDWNRKQNKEQFLSILLDGDRTFDKAAAGYLKSTKDSGLLELYEEWSKPALLTIFVGNRILDELDKLYPGIDIRPEQDSLPEAKQHTQPEDILLKASANAGAFSFERRAHETKKSVSQKSQ